MIRPHGRYTFTCDITASVFGTADQSVTLFHDFECEITVDVDLSTGEPIATTLEVYVGDKALANGDALAKAIRLQVMEKADEAMARGNGPWDEVRQAEGLTHTGPVGSPDARWEYA